MILLQAAKGENGMKRKRGFSLVLCLFLLSCLLPQAVGAERIDPERECSLTVELYEDGAPVEGFPFGLFYAASVRAQGGFTLAGDFQDCPVEINGLTAAQYTDLARILDAYARQNSLKPLAKKDTGANGCAGFDALEPGLYLVGSSTAVLGGKKITVDPFLVSLPGQK